MDWIRRSVKVDRQLVRDGGPKPVFGPVKDRRNRPRTIPLPGVVIDALAEHVKVFGLGPSGLLFTNTKGEPVRRSSDGRGRSGAQDERGMERQGSR